MEHSEHYLDDDGFLDIPTIITQNKQHDLFPGLLQDTQKIRSHDFPLFNALNRIYLDSAATSQEPQSVKEKIFEYRKNHIRGSNHTKHSSESIEAKQQFETAREKVHCFFNAHNYIVAFTSGTTDTSNWVATRFPLKKDDLLLITEAEHNSQVITARNIAQKNNVDICYLPIQLPEGRLDLKALETIVSQKKKGRILLNLVHASNVSGIINPVKQIRQILGDKGFIYLDMAQSAGHKPINLDSLDVDFAGVSSHKMYGPMGLGAVFINKKSKKMLDSMISGGSAVRMISRRATVPSGEPARFEPGTQDIEGAIEWGYAIDYLNNIGMEKIESHEKTLGTFFINELKKIKGIRIYGPQTFSNRTSIITFNMESFLKKRYDKVSVSLDKKGISVSDGCFCAHQYTSQLLGIPKIIADLRAGMMTIGLSEEIMRLSGAVRVSFAFYNTLEEAYKTITVLRELSKQC